MHKEAQRELLVEQFPIYTPELAKRSFKKALPQSVYLDPEGIIQTLNETMTTMNRVDTNLPISHASYIGKWNSQGAEPTCSPWSLANAYRVIGVQPHFPLLSELLNHANGDNPTGITGVKADDLLTIVSEFPKRGMEFTNVELPLQSTELWASDEAIRENAATIKHYLDRGSAFHVLIGFDMYARQFSDEAHAVCLSGYHINRYREMNVQIIDSNIGVVWTSIEHISSSLLAGQVHVVSKKK